MGRARWLPRDLVALVGQGVADGGRVDGGLVVGELDGPGGHVDGRGADAGEAAEGGLDGPLAVVAGDVGDREGLGGHGRSTVTAGEGDGVGSAGPAVVTAAGRRPGRGRRPRPGPGGAPGWPGDGPGRRSAAAGSSRPRRHWTGSWRPRRPSAGGGRRRPAGWRPRCRRRPRTGSA